MITFYWRSQWYRMCPVICLFTGINIGDYYFGFISLKSKEHD